MVNINLLPLNLILLEEETILENLAPGSVNAGDDLYRAQSLTLYNSMCCSSYPRGLTMANKKAKYRLLAVSYRISLCI